MVKALLVVTAIIEGATGLALLCCPSMVSVLLLGSPLDTPTGLVVARVAGAALLALGVANWLARDDARSRAAIGLSAAMVMYNLGAVCILAVAGVQSQKIGIGLWPAVVLHAALVVWRIAIVSRHIGGSTKPLPTVGRLRT